MIQQHMGMWLWDVPRLSLAEMFHTYPIMMSVNWCGSFAAPLFIILAGMGSFLFLAKGGRALTLILRGILLLVLGYLLNLFSPHWFSPISWYVLHLIGISLILSPMIFRLPPSSLPVLAVFIILGAVILQTWLGTPLLLTDRMMGNAENHIAPVRLALAEGHFPLFPWLSFFITGIFVARWYCRKQLLRITVLAVFLIAVGFALTLLHHRGYAFATYGPLYRLFVFLPYFFPPLPPLLLILAGISLLLISGTMRLKASWNSLPIQGLQALGRTSLTSFFIHILVFNELSRALGPYRALTPLAAAAAILGFLLAWTLLALLWRRYGYRYGLEWLVRRLAG